MIDECNEEVAVLFEFSHFINDQEESEDVDPKWSDWACILVREGAVNLVSQVVVQLATHKFLPHSAIRD